MGFRPGAALGDSLSGLKDLAAGSRPNNSCWRPVLRSDGVWNWEPYAPPGMRHYRVFANDKDNTYQQFGLSGADGGGVSSSGFTNIAGTIRRYVQHSINATIGQQAGRSFGGGTADTCTLSTLRLFLCSFRVPTSLSTIRFRVGLAAQPMNVVWNADAPSNHQFDLRFSTNASDTEFMLSSKDATTVLTAALDAPPGLTAGDWWDLAFSVAPNGGSIEVWASINGGVWTKLATRATSLPFATQGLNVYCGGQTLAAASKVFGIGSAAIVAA